MYVFAARGVGALTEYTISFISPYCFLVDGNELNLAMKKEWLIMLNKNRNLLCMCNSYKC